MNTTQPTRRDQDVAVNGLSLAALMVTHLLVPGPGRGRRRLQLNLCLARRIGRHMDAVRGNRPTEVPLSWSDLRLWTASGLRILADELEATR